jgi:hypothetical protein
MAAQITSAEYALYHGCSRNTARRHLRKVAAAYPNEIRVDVATWHEVEDAPPRWERVYEAHLHALKEIVKCIGWRRETWLVMNLIEMIEEGRCG